MKLRRARAEDAAAIARIWNHEIRDGVSTFNSVEKSVDEVAETIAARVPAFVVAEEDGTVMGFATYSQFRGGVGYAHTMEHTIHLVEAARGRGAGRALIDALAGIGRSQGVHSLIAGVSGENIDGVAFHAAVGFAEVGRLPQVGRKYGRWMDLVLMQKML